MEPTLASLIREALDIRKESIRSLAKATGISYEHARKIVRGEASPSRHLLPVICQWLGIDPVRSQTLANMDRVRRKMPDIAIGVETSDPQLEPLIKIWGKLNTHQREDLISLATRWANRHTGEADS